MPLQSIPALILLHKVSPHNLTFPIPESGVKQSSAGVPVQIVVVVLDVVEVLVELVDVVEVVDVEVVLVVDVDVLVVDVEVELVLVVDVVDVELVDVVEVDVELVDVVVDGLEQRPPIQIKPAQQSVSIIQPSPTLWHAVVVEVDVVDVLPDVVAPPFKIFLHTSSVGLSPQEVSQYGSGNP